MIMVFVREIIRLGGLPFDLSIADRRIDTACRFTTWRSIRTRKKLLTTPSYKDIKMKIPEVGTEIKKVAARASRIYFAPLKGAFGGICAGYRRLSMNASEPTRQVNATVFLLAPEFNYVLARDACDNQYGLNRGVEGVDIDFLKVGMSFNAR